MEIIDRINKYIQTGREWYDRTYPIKKITVHHTASRYTGTDDQILTALMNEHIKNDWPGLSYHFVILKNGNIYQINPLNKVTWHDTVNWDSIGISLHGYFHPDYNESPTAEQLASLDALLDNLCAEHPEFPADYDDVLGHRERSATACPGNNLFPKVVDYRTNLGNVDWETPVVITPETPTNCLDLTKDIPSEIEDKYGLKDKTWYDKHWTGDEFIKYCITLGQQEMAFRAFLQYINAKLTGTTAVAPKALKDEENDLQTNVDKALTRLASINDKDLTKFATSELRNEVFNRTVNSILEKLGVAKTPTKP